MGIPLMFSPRCGHGIGDRQSMNVKFFIDESTIFVQITT
jgi:hypothetical protein